MFRILRTQLNTTAGTSLATVGVFGVEESEWGGDVQYISFQKSIYCVTGKTDANEQQQKIDTQEFLDHLEWKSLRMQQWRF